MTDRGDAGTSLVEVLMAVSIMGITFVAVLSGMATAIVVSDQHRGQADGNAVLVAAVEKVKSRDTLYVNCASQVEYLDEAQTVTPLPTGWTASSITITSVQYWTGAFGPTCPGGSELPLQLVTVAVSSPDGRATETVSFVKAPSPA